MSPVFVFWRGWLGEGELEEQHREKLGELQGEQVDKLGDMSKGALAGEVQEELEEEEGDERKKQRRM